MAVLVTSLIPESPRWQATSLRLDKAKMSLTRMYSPGNSEEIEIEYAAIMAEVEDDRAHTGMSILRGTNLASPWIDRTSTKEANPAETANYLDSSSCMATLEWGPNNDGVLNVFLPIVGDR